MKNVIVLMVCAFPAIGGATVVWNGGFETGNFSQWSEFEIVSTDRIVLSQSMVREGSYAAKVVVKPGDTLNGGTRSELVYNSRTTEGSERYFAWSTYWPTDYPSIDKWQLFTQFHHTGCCGSPPIEMYVRGDEMRLGTNTEGGGNTIHWQAPLVRGKWRDFILHVKWSSNAAVGLLELYLDGARVFGPKAVATLYSGMTNYLKQGLYRDSSIAVEQTIFHDGLKEATALSDVLPSEPVVVTPTPTTPSEPTEPPAVVETTDQTASSSAPTVSKRYSATNGCGSRGVEAIAILLMGLVFTGGRRVD
jgi:hypothetical protein